MNTNVPSSSLHSAGSGARHTFTDTLLSSRSRQRSRFENETSSPKVTHTHTIIPMQQPKAKSEFGSPRAVAPTKLNRRTSALSVHEDDLLESAAFAAATARTSQLGQAPQQQQQAFATKDMRSNSMKGGDSDSDDEYPARPHYNKPTLTTKQSLMATGLLFFVSIGAMLNSSYNELPTAASQLQHSMQCTDGVCSVQFGTSKAGKFDMVPQRRSLFAEDMVIDRDGVETPAKPTHILYESKPGSKDFASAVVDPETNTLISGIFIDGDDFKEGEKQVVIEHNIQATLHDRVPGEDEHVVLEMPGIGQPWLSPKFAKRGGGEDDDDVDEVYTTSSIQTAQKGAVTPFFPGCYSKEGLTQVFKMNVIYDYGLASSFGSESRALADLDILFSMGKLVFLQQLNIRLEIDRVYMGTASSPAPLQMSKSAGTCLNALAALPKMIDWSKKNAQKSGFNLLVSNCFSGITGTSYIGSACSASLNANVAAHSWLIAFHELGHAFGMSHSFENGMGVTGGLMDYGNGLYNGVAQFHPNKRKEVCPFLNYMIPSCKYVEAAGVAASCGDGILTADEECECLTQGKTSCGKCVNCKAAADVECSSSEFLLRTANTPKTAVVANSDLRHDSQCCIRNKFAPAKTLCGSGKLDACALGRCEQVCSKYLDQNNPHCGFDATGCILQCKFNGVCRDNLSFKENGKSLLVGGLPDGSNCIMKDTKVAGQCKNYACVAKRANAEIPLPAEEDPDVPPPPQQEEKSVDADATPPSDDAYVSPCAGLKASPCKKSARCRWVSKTKTCLDKATKAPAIGKTAKRGVNEEEEEEVEEEEEEEEAEY